MGVGVIPHFRDIAQIRKQQNINVEKAVVRSSETEKPQDDPSFFSWLPKSFLCWQALGSSIFSAKPSHYISATAKYKFLNHTTNQDTAVFCLYRPQSFIHKMAHVSASRFLESTTELPLPHFQHPHLVFSPCLV